MASFARRSAHKEATVTLYEGHEAAITFGFAIHMVQGLQRHGVGPSSDMGGLRERFGDTLGIMEANEFRVSTNVIKVTCAKGVSENALQGRTHPCQPKHHCHGSSEGWGPVVMALPPQSRVGTHTEVCCVVQ